MFSVLFSIAGISRSCTVVAAYLIVVGKVGWKEAITAIRVSRSVANPNHGFQRQLEEFELKKASEVKNLRFPDLIFFQFSLLS